MPIRQIHLRREGAAATPHLPPFVCLKSANFQIETRPQVIIRRPDRDRPVSGVLRL